MLSPRWRKVLSDLWGNKTRTVLVVLSIAIGVFAVGAIAHMNLIVVRDLAISYAATNPPNATLSLGDPVDDDFVRAVRKIEGVREAEGRRAVIMRFKHGSEGEWLPIIIFAVPDYENIRISKIEQEIVFAPDPEKWPTGAWPPPEHEVVLERTSLLSPQMGLIRARLGDMITVQTPDGREREVRLAGLCYDFGRIPATFRGIAYGYVTFDTLEWLGGPPDYDELNITVTGNAQDTAHIKRVADRVRDKVETSGRIVYSVEVHQPGKLPLDETFQTISLVLGVLGFFSLFLSGFLVINTVSALLAQQVRQIGVMKAIGARTGQLIGMYLVLVLVFGLLALCIAVPLGAWATDWFIGFLSYFLNFQLGAFRLPPEIIAVEVGIGLLVPFLAAFLPVLNGVRITVREAITSYGLGQGRFGSSWVDRLLEQVRGLPRPLTISLRNTFRRKNRLALTLLTLILGCAIFVSVMSTRASLYALVDDFLEYFSYDVQIGFERSYRIAQIDEAVRQTPRLVRVEYMDGANAYRLRADNSESQAIQITAVPFDTQMFKPQLVRGRWLLPDDENAIVLNTQVIEKEPDIQVGDDIILKIRGREMTWHVVGIFQSLPIFGLMAHVNYPYFVRAVHRQPDQAGGIVLSTLAHDADTQSRIAKELEERLQDAGIRTQLTYTSTQMRAGIGQLFDIITLLLSAMAAMVAAVGGLGLMGSMGINVLERTREIGVLRAIGASDSTVQQIVMTEGILIGVLSWLAGVLIALPMGKVLGDAVGMGLLNTPLRYAFSVQGALACLAGVVVLAAAASFLPAQRASQLTIRETLAYE